MPAGKFNCLLIEPFLAGDGLFKASGRLWISVTDDDRKMPVLMKSKILVGSVTAELKSTNKFPDVFAFSGLILIY